MLLVTLRMEQNRERQWKLIAFTTIFAMPLIFLAGVINFDLNKMKQVTFCDNCHTMNPYVMSLTVDDDEPLASVHFRNNYIPQETACYSCHTSYSMFGGFEAKVRGLRHVWVYYTNPDKQDIALYKPYDNNDCLHCHGPSQRFKTNKKHRREINFIERVDSGQLSCLASGCHDLVHLFETEEEQIDEDW